MRCDEPVFVAVLFFGLTGILHLEKFYVREDTFMSKYVYDLRTSIRKYIPHMIYPCVYFLTLLIIGDAIGLEW